MADSTVDHDGVAALSPPDPPLTDGVVALRPFDERDVGAIEASARDPEIQRWFGQSTVTGGEVLERKRRAWLDGSAASFAICDAGDDATCVGQVFIEMGEDRRGQVGYWLLQAARGAGRAVRAVKLASSWAFRDVGLGRLQLWAEPVNAASVRVAERSGFQPEGILRAFIEREGARRDVVFYSLLPSDIAPDRFAKPS